jgi:pimeloyl-ACP methyl ester carboxylesterase
MKRILATLAFVMAALVLQACGGGNQVKVMISPTSVTLAPGDIQQFKATVTGTSNTAVTWSATDGTISGSGKTITYTAPDTEETASITAKSVEDPAALAKAKINVSYAKEETSGTVGSDGGDISVSGGSVVEFEPATLSTSTKVSLKTFENPAVQPLPDFKAIANRTQVELPYEALDTTQEHKIYIGVPARDDSDSQNGHTLAAVRIKLGDGSYYGYTTNYDPTEENVVPISTTALKTLFAAYPPAPEKLVISVQPLSLSAISTSSEQNRLEPQRNYDTVQGLFSISNSYKATAGKDACKKNPELPPSSMTLAEAADVPSNKIPLVLIHGWQGFSDNFYIHVHAPPFVNPGKAGYDPALCDWLDFINDFTRDSALSSRYALFTYGYNSNNAVQCSAGTQDPDNTDSDCNAFSLASFIKNVFGDREIVLVAHSMGGLVADTYVRQHPNNHVKLLLTLGAPYHGSRALLCVDSNAGRCTKIRAIDGANAIPGLGIAAALNSQGARDLAWEHGGIIYSMATICEAGICSSGPGETRKSVDNPFLAKLNSDLHPSDYTNYVAFAGRNPSTPNPFSPNYKYGVMSSFLWLATGLVSDGIVPTQSACLSASAAKDNDCAHKVLATEFRNGFSHSDLKNQKDFAAIKAELLTVAPLATGTVAVSVEDAVTGDPVSDVTITTPTGDIGNVTEAPPGTYQATLPVGTYNLTLSKTGYLDLTINNVEVRKNETTHLQRVLYIDKDYDSPADASGQIKDAITGGGVDGAELDLRQGINATSGTVIASTATDSGGYYSFSSLNAGYYTAEVSEPGYTSSSFTITVVGGQANDNQNASITPILPEGQWRIVLTWGATPSDLDSHLTGPAVPGDPQPDPRYPSSDRFHVFWPSPTVYGNPYNRRDYTYNGTTYAHLDVDDITSYGPETITLYQLTGGDGVYRYSVHNYSDKDSTDSRSLADSGAQVRVYKGSTLERTFNVPNEEGTLWTVFVLDFSQTDPIVPVNTMSYEATPWDVQSIGQGAPTDAGLIRNEPEK